MKALSLPLFKEEAQQLRKGEGLGRETLSLPYSMRMGYDGTRPDRWDAPCPTKRRLVRWDVAWVWPTTTALQA